MLPMAAGLVRYGWPAVPHAQWTGQEGLRSIQGRQKLLSQAPRRQSNEEVEKSGPRGEGRLCDCPQENTHFMGLAQSFCFVYNIPEISLPYTAQTCCSTRNTTVLFRNNPCYSTLWMIF